MQWLCRYSDLAGGWTAEVSWFYSLPLVRSDNVTSYQGALPMDATTVTWHLVPGLRMSGASLPPITCVNGVHSVNVPLPSFVGRSLHENVRYRERERETERVLWSAVQPRTKNVEYVSGFEFAEEWWLERPGRGGCVQINPLNAELNPICHLLALLGGATIVVVSRLRVNRQDVDWYESVQWIEVAQVASCNGFGVNPL